jgi:hypothetical protein
MLDFALGLSGGAGHTAAAASSLPDETAELANLRRIMAAADQKHQQRHQQSSRSRSFASAGLSDDDEDGDIPIPDRVAGSDSEGDGGEANEEDSALHTEFVAAMQAYVDALVRNRSGAATSRPAGAAAGAIDGAGAAVSAGAAAGAGATPYISPTRSHPDDLAHEPLLLPRSVLSVPSLVGSDE